MRDSGWHCRAGGQGADGRLLLPALLLGRALLRLLLLRHLLLQLHQNETLKP